MVPHEITKQPRPQQKLDVSSLDESARPAMVTKLLELRDEWLIYIEHPLGLLSDRHFEYMVPVSDRIRSELGEWLDVKECGSLF
jgi:hypothetical protein